MIDEAGSGAPTARAEAALGWTVSLEQWEMERPLKAPSVSVTFGPITPILRIFDIAKARAFYLDYLGCAVDFEHRFEPELPLYMQVSRGALVLHLSEHHGDGSPGVHVRIKVDDVRALHAELTAKGYNYLRPGIVHQEWGEDSVNLTDPFGNVLSFFEPTP